MAFITNSKLLWVVIITLVILNLISLGSVWHTRRNIWPNRNWTKERPFDTRNKRNNPPPGNEHFLKRELNFTADQQAEFDTLAKLHRKNLDSISYEIKLLREQLVERMKNKEFDSNSETIIQQIGEKQAGIELINYRNFLSVMEICNDEQKEKFLGLMQRAFKPRHDYHNDGARK